MNSKGLTLIELMVVLAIIAMLATFALTGYHATTQKVKVESEIKALYGNLQNARMRAFAEKRVWGVCWSGSSFTSYSLGYDNNGDGSIDNYTGTVSDLAYPVKVNSNSTTCAKFNPSGWARSLTTFHIEGVDDAEYDCVSVSKTRIKMGKWDESSSECVKR